MKDLFKKGISFRSYIFNLEDKYKHNMMKYYLPMKIEGSISEQIKGINKKINILAVVDPKSPDCWINLSLLEKLISTNDDIKLSIILRDIIKNELDDYKIDDFIKVPTIIFMNAKFKVINSFIEKPQVLKQADINTMEGTKLNARYMLSGLIEETSKEFLEKLLSI
ncbi:MAG: thioredoxin family protein [Firmicutes bacterium]|nr:thioredoxin family protein [Bacillota bacterium]